MRLPKILPGLLLALALTACGGDEEPKEAADPSTQEDAQTAQADAILECTSGKGLPGSIGVIEDGVPAIDLTTEYETIVVYVMASSEDAAGFQNPADLDQEQIDNVLIVGGAISPEHHTVIVDCIEAA